MPKYTSISKSSPEGITVGLIDSIITAAHVLSGREFIHPVVLEALKDLRQDSDVRRLLSDPIPAWTCWHCGYQWIGEHAPTFCSCGSSVWNKPKVAPHV